MRPTTLALLACLAAAVSPAPAGAQNPSFPSGTPGAIEWEYTCPAGRLCAVSCKNAAGGLGNDPQMIRRAVLREYNPNGTVVHWVLLTTAATTASGGSQRTFFQQFQGPTGCLFDNMDLVYAGPAR